MPILRVRSDITEAAIEATFDTDSKKIRLPEGVALAINPDDYQSQPQSNFQMARDWLEAGDLQLNPNGPLIAMVPLDMSPSAARVLVTGRPGNGWFYWKISEADHLHHGEFIDVLRNEYQNQAVPPPAETFQWGGLLLHLGQHDFYDHLRNRFAALDRFVELDRDSDAILNRANWPMGQGVYVVWQAQDGQADSMLYVGLAGRLRDEGQRIALNGGCLSSRMGRCHPYCFQREGMYAAHFEYGPRFKVQEIRGQPENDRYRYHISLKSIKVHCFKLDGIERHISPALLESLILQNHVSLHERLPPANNQL